MNKKILSGLAVLALLAVSGSSNAFGGTVTLTAGAFQSGSGGEFQAHDDSNALGAYIASYDQVGTPNSLTGTGNTASQTFQTFCIEYNEHFSFDGTYNVAGISDSARSGGLAVSDHLSVGTAYLYSQFAKGTLAGYSYDGGATARRVSAAALQSTIWWLENEIAGNTGTVPNPSNSFSALVQGLFGAVGTQTAGTNGSGGGAASDTWTGAGSYTGQSGSNNVTFGVYALNLGVGVQDQLIYKTPGNTNVPDGGATVMLLGIAMASMATVRRRFL